MNRRLFQILNSYTQLKIRVYFMTNDSHRLYNLILLQYWHFGPYKETTCAL